MDDRAALEAEVVRLRARVAELESELAALKAAFAKFTAAPSAPPAWAKARHRKSRPQKSGAREGHEPRNREDRPVDEDKDAKLSTCPECETELGEAIDVRERIVEDIVPARLKVTRFRVGRYWCSTCEEKIEARVDGVLPGQRFGLQFMLMICFLRTLGVTWEKIRAYFHQSFNIRVSHGALVHMEQVVAEALGAKYAELVEELRQAKSVHADDTGWRVDGVNHWLWVLLSKGAAVFTVQQSRKSKVVEDVLGEDYDGVVTTDFHPAFKKLPYKKQKCLIHLLRELSRFEKKPDFIEDAEWRSVRLRVKRLVTEAIDVHVNVTDVEERESAKIGFVARALTLATISTKNSYTRRVQKLVEENADDLFTFLTEPDVHWENNPAERGLRPMVVNRKASFGSRSHEGAQRLSVIQSVAQTARLRGLPFHEFAAGGIPGHGIVPGR